MKILVLSNGRGEDSLAVTLIKSIEKLFLDKHLHHLSVDAFPIVGDGEAYRREGISVVGVGQHLPSRGFGGSHLSYLLEDVKAGLIKTAFKQVGMLREISKAYDIIISVGDIYPLILAAFFTKKLIFHVATAVSVSYKRFGAIEIELFKRKCKAFFTRDPETARELLNKGVRAKFVGNIMMDDPNIASKDVPLEIDKNRTAIALLPSSRGDAAENVVTYLSVINNLKDPDLYEFLLSVASEHQFGEIAEKVDKDKWRIDKAKEWKTPVIGRILGAGGHIIKVIRGHFGDVVRASTIVIGSTGTGSEQAAGLGKPLVILRTQGPHTSPARINMYSKMLAGAVFVPDGSSEQIAQKIKDLLGDKAKLDQMSEAGRRLMGGGGASPKIAEEILKLCQNT